MATQIRHSPVPEIDDAVGRFVRWRCNFTRAATHTVRHWHGVYLRFANGRWWSDNVLAETLGKCRLIDAHPRDQHRLLDGLRSLDMIGVHDLNAHMRAAWDVYRNADEARQVENAREALSGTGYKVVPK